MGYATDLQPKTCTESVHGETMIQGKGGGFGFQISDLERLQRFLILGHEGGTYYAGQQELTIETVDCIDRLVLSDPIGMVDCIVTISKSGRAPKNDPAIFALAYIISKHKDKTAAKLALDGVKHICRTSTHLFLFIDFCKKMGRGWGSAFKRTVAEWYTSKTPKQLAYQVTKYPQRHGWSHRDVLRQCHAQSDELNSVLQYVTQPQQWLQYIQPNNDGTKLLLAYSKCKADNDFCPDSERIELIHDQGLVREHMPTQSLNNPKIWEALLDGMPIMAMVRNLGKMGNVGLLTPMSDASMTVVNHLECTVALKESRIHPLQLLLALKTYRRGCGIRGSLTWQVDQNVCEALESAFYMAFDNVEPIDKRYMLGVDVSGSMTQACMGTELLSCREASVVMAMVTARTTERKLIHGFSHTFVDLGIKANSSLSEVTAAVSNLPFARTNCSLPMQYAAGHGIPIDVFCIYTDNETNCGPHPYAALQAYRDKMGIDAKLAVFGMANSDFSIAKPDDAGMMDFVGFDSASPTLLSEFAK